MSERRGPGGVSKRRIETALVAALYFFPLMSILLQAPIYPFYHYPMYSAWTNSLEGGEFTIRMLYWKDPATGKEEPVLPGSRWRHKRMFLDRIDAITRTHHSCPGSSPCSSPILEKIREELLVAGSGQKRSLLLYKKSWKVSQRPRADRPDSVTLEGVAE